jgi:hypothetical protein
MSGEAGSWGELGLFGKPNTRDITMTMARDFSREKKYPDTVTINLSLESQVPKVFNEDKLDCMPNGP